MRYDSLENFLTDGKDALLKGPIAMVFAEDDVEIDTTIRHHQQSGFDQILVFMSPMFDLAPDVADRVQRIDYNTTQEYSVQKAVNKIIAAAPGIWMYYCYNAEYLFHPF